MHNRLILSIAASIAFLSVGCGSTTPQPKTPEMSNEVVVPVPTKEEQKKVEDRFVDASGDLYLVYKAKLKEQICKP